MGISTLYLIDPTTPPFALRLLRLLTAAAGAGAARLIVLGPMGEIRRQAVRKQWGKDVSFCHAAGWWDPNGWRAVRRALVEHPADVAQAWGIWGAAALATCGNRAGQRVLALQVQPTAGELRLLRIITRRGVWTITSGSATLTQALAAAGLPGERIVTIPPGIDLAAARGANIGALRERLGIEPGDGPIVLTAAPGEKAARLDHTFWAVAIFQQLFPRLRIIVPACDAAHPTAARFAETLGWPEMLCFAPPEMTLPELAQAAEMAVFTPDAPASIEPLLWAMAAGCPVIATATPAIGEVIEHGRNGLLARPGKPRLIAGRMEELMADATLRWPLTDAARRDVYSHYAISNMTAGYAGLTDRAPAAHAR